MSRWDKLKDMSGVMRGFADHVVPDGDGYLLQLADLFAAATGRWPAPAGIMPGWPARRGY